MSHVPLGQRVLRQGVIFLDLAIAQAAALGVVLAHLFGIASSHVTALICAMSMAGILQCLAKAQVKHLEAWIGCSFVLTASIGAWLLAGNVHGSEHLRDILMGQILWVTPKQLGIALGYYALAAMLLLFNRFKYLKADYFYLIFAICITAAVQLVGIYLVFATLIMPALASSPLKNPRHQLLLGYALSLFAYSLGIALSYYWDTPTSPMIITCMAISLIGTLGWLSARS